MNTWSNKTDAELIVELETNTEYRKKYLQYMRQLDHRLEDMSDSVALAKCIAALLKNNN
jgi:hypothetical protein